MVSHLLESIPPEAVYLIVGLMIMMESLGIPVPGEIALVTAFGRLGRPPGSPST